MRNELILRRSDPINRFRLEGLSLVGDEPVTSETDEHVHDLVPPKSSRSGVSFSLLSNCEDVGFSLLVLSVRIM
jgi:hypothetical protein